MNEKKDTLENIIDTIFIQIITNKSIGLEIYISDANSNGYIRCTPQKTKQKEKPLK